MAINEQILNDIFVNNQFGIFFSALINHPLTKPLKMM